MIKRNRCAILIPALAVLAMLGAGADRAPADAADIETIAILAPEQATDFGWNQQGVEAAREVAEAYGLELIVAEGLGYDDVRPTLRELAADGADLMIAHAAGYNTAAPEIAEETGVPVAITDRPDLAQPSLVADYTLSGHDGAYLAGRLAARMTRTGTLGIVVSDEPPSWNSQSAAFAEGVRAERSDITLRYAVIGPAAYSDAAGGRRVTESLIAAGADIIFGQGDGSSFGMLEAVKTTKAVDGGKVYFIDVIGDKSSLDDTGHLLTSVVWNMTPVFSAMVEDLRQGTFGTKPYALSLADDSVHLLKTGQIPEEQWAAVLRDREEILSGAVTVEPKFDAREVRAMMSAVAD